MAKISLRNRITKERLAAAKAGRLEFLAGSDFEFFIFSKEENRIVNAIDVIKHGKEDVLNLGNGVNFYFDNMAGEATVNPFSTKEQMVSTFKDAFSRVQNWLGNKYSPVFRAGHTFEDRDITSDKCLEIGCSPSFDCWKMEVVNNQPFTNNFRSTGGHWHVSGNLFDSFETKVNSVKIADILIGLPNLLCVSDPTEKERRKLYGASGTHRLPGHGGIEVRILSSSFFNSKELTELKYDLLSYAMSHIKNKTALDIINSVNSNDVQEAINTCNRPLAEKLLNKIDLPAELRNRIHEYDLSNFQASWGL